jgi:DNA invertase Pin-like site-specific DNA recombinase
MTEAYGYIRCSGLGQMSLDGPVRQRQAIEDLCSRRGIKIVSFYEEAYTGSDLEGRAQFHEMRRVMLENGVKTVVCEKLDRIARDIIIQESIIADFNKNGITLISATPGEEDLCSTDPTRVLVRQILGSFFEYERKMIVLKTRAARERLRAKNGRCEGRKPFGTRDGEQLVLATILQLAGEGWNGDRIARYLNELGAKTRYGSEWNSGTVWKIIERNRSRPFETETTPKP